MSRATSQTDLSIKEINSDSRPHPNAAERPSASDHVGEGSRSEHDR